MSELSWMVVSAAHPYMQFNWKIKPKFFLDNFRIILLFFVFNPIKMLFKNCLWLIEPTAYSLINIFYIIVQILCSACSVFLLRQSLQWYNFLTIEMKSYSLLFKLYDTATKNHLRFLCQCNFQPCPSPGIKTIKLSLP